MTGEYNPEEWTPCPADCAYCCDPFYGHPHPHITQKRITELDNKVVLAEKDIKPKAE